MLHPQVGQACGGGDHLDGEWCRTFHHFLGLVGRDAVCLPLGEEQLFGDGRLRNDKLVWQHRQPQVLVHHSVPHLVIQQQVRRPLEWQHRHDLHHHLHLLLGGQHHRHRSDMDLQARRRCGPDRQRLHSRPRVLVAQIQGHLPSSVHVHALHTDLQVLVLIEHPFVLDQQVCKPGIDGAYGLGRLKVWQGLLLGGLLLEGGGAKGAVVTEGLLKGIGGAGYRRGRAKAWVR
mmetsp:Transcript_1751/g.3977  ORF Transcript_1751/g.3977 Transcript_1751/m.3977 type:complete len:231 (+) Transcript_1751:1616-2308(+)